MIKMKDKFKKYRFASVAIVVAVIIAIAGDSGQNKFTEEIAVTTTETVTVNPHQELNGAKKTKVSLSDIPEYSDEAYVVIDNNEPSFSKREITDKSFEEYSKPDYLGRCGTVMACIGKDIMPTEERGSISHVKPTGWHSVKYDFVDGQSLYNRCHLIGYQLTGENDNERNLITGTRYLNVEGMLPFEDMVADYVKETNNHVMYRVIPIYESDNLLASGVAMEAYSVEDKGEGISFHVYCYNVQPNVKINYANGESELEKDIGGEKQTIKKVTGEDTSSTASTEYILNMNSYKFHYSYCEGASTISNDNKGTYIGDRQELINQGYDPCKRCNP